MAAVAATTIMRNMSMRNMHMKNTITTMMSIVDVAAKIMSMNITIMITDENIAIERCVKMIKEGKVTSINGKELDIKGDTLCVHGDGPKALAFVQKIREKFTEEGIEIKHL